MQDKKIRKIKDLLVVFPSLPKKNILTKFICAPIDVAVEVWPHLALKRRQNMLLFLRPQSDLFTIECGSSSCIS